jgi:hypothetical protein
VKVFSVIGACHQFVKAAVISKAFFQKVPCVTLGTETEWTELLPFGYHRSGCRLTDSISGKTTNVLSSKPDCTIDLYGNEHFSELIDSSILKFTQ